MNKTAVLMHQLQFSPIIPSRLLHLQFSAKSHSFVSLSFFPSQSPLLSRSRARSRAPHVKASRGESPYQVLGVSPAATQDEIKRAYRKLALKFHPDVNKEKNAQERFMRIKHAYNALMNSESRYNYASNNSNYSKSSEKKSNVEEEEPFYGLGDFFKDLQEEFRNWEADLNREEKPKSLWAELSEIGEEFVDFLEKELNVKEINNLEKDNYYSTKQKSSDNSGENSVNDAIDDVEAVLAQLKKDLGL